MRHESANILLLAPHLQWLEAREPRYAHALMYVMDYLATPRETRGPGKYLVADIVAGLDCFSAASRNRRDLANLVRAANPGRKVTVGVVANDQRY